MELIALGLQDAKHNGNHGNGVQCYQIDEWARGLSRSGQNFARHDQSNGSGNDGNLGRSDRKPADIRMALRSLLLWRHT